MKLTKESRQRATAAMTKCACGNVARLGWHRCGKCEAEAEEHGLRESALHFCNTVDDLKQFITDYLLKE